MTAQRKKIGASLEIPVIFFGSPYVPVEALRRKLKLERDAVFTQGRDPIKIARTLLEKGKGVLLVHVHSEMDFKQTRELLSQLMPAIAAQNIGCLVITKTYTEQMQSLAQGLPLIDILPTLSEGHDLFRNVQELLHTVKDPEAKRGIAKISVVAEPPKDFENQQLFSLVGSAEERVAVLSEALEAHSQIMVSALDLSFRGHGTMESLQLADGNFVLRSSDLPQDPQLYAEVVLVSFGLKRSRIFFKCEMEYVGDKRFRGKIPDRVFEVQRRTHMRLYLSEVLTWQGTIRTGVESKRVVSQILDVSAGGVAIAVAPEHMSGFQIGDQIGNIKFQIGKRDIFVTSAEVRHFTQIQKPGDIWDGYFQVGLMFKKILPRDAAFLGIYVFRHSLDYINKMLG